MQNKIKYAGITTHPSNQESPDGDLGVCINLINENEGLKPILPLEKLFSLDYYLQGQEKKTHSLLYVHKVQDTTMYIILDGVKDKIVAYKLIGSLLSPVSDIPLSSGDNIISITSIGATLVIATEHRGISYALFKGDKYIYLGEKPPFTALSFGLRGVAKAKTFTLFDGNDYINDPDVDSNYFFKIVEGRSEFKETFFTSSIPEAKRPHYETALTDTLMPALNEFVNINAIEKGMFMMPFFVRYAYRLSDGTHIMHSAPILMVPNSNIMATIGGGAVFSQAMIDAQLFAVSCNLNVCSCRPDKDIKKWSDIITGIDVFVSAPIYTHNQNGKVTGWSVGTRGRKHYMSDARFSYIKAPSSDYSIIDFGDDEYMTRDFPAVFMGLMGPDQPGDHMTNVGKGYRFPYIRIYVPETEDLSAKITSTSLFYKVATLSIDDLFAYTEDTARKTLDISATTLKTLEQRERLTDDYVSHNQLTAGCSYVYNSRLYLADVSQYLFNGFSTNSMLQYSNCYSDLVLDEAYVFIKKEGKEFILREATWSRRSIYDIRYLFYPDPDAYKMVLKMRKWTLEFTLTPSDFLHGAYWFGNFADVPLVQKTAPAGTTSDLYHTANKLFSSSVNNPFRFPPEGTNNIGTNAKIIAISATTKALSQGQFGQFPLYAFKEDGVWAIKIGDDGSFLECQPVTRDVINNPELLQVDGGIIFSTEQGLRLINGPESTSVSDILNEPSFNTTKLPHLEDILLSMNKKTLLHNIVLFKEYLLGCKMAYDYANSRIYVTNENYNYSYVYALKSNSWSIKDGSFVDVVNNYPTSFVVDKEMNVYDISQHKPHTTQGLLITRPIKLGAPDTLKTIRETKHHIVESSGCSTKTALYGSMDCQKYHLVASSNNEYIRRIGGTPYKYFVFVVGVDLNFGDELLGTSLVFDIKRDNKLR